jgi:hypothetical protein
MVSAQERGQLPGVTRRDALRIRGEMLDRARRASVLAASVGVCCRRMSRHRSRHVGTA